MSLLTTVAEMPLTQGSALVYHCSNFSAVAFIIYYLSFGCFSKFAKSRFFFCCSHRKVVMGGDEMVPDSSEEREGKTEYRCTWLTNGYQPTRKSVSLLIILNHNMEDSIINSGSIFEKS